MPDVPIEKIRPPAYEGRARFVGVTRPAEAPWTCHASGHDNDYDALIRCALEALVMIPPSYIKSILGPLHDRLPPYRELSEFGAVSVWHPRSTIEFIARLAVPAYAHAPGPLASTMFPPGLRDLLWRPSGYFQQADPFGSTSSYPKERWFFINGVATDAAVAQLNSRLIAQMFERPITVIHNSTRSLGLDLLQAAVGKSFTDDPQLTAPQTMTEPAFKATRAILHAMEQPSVDRVVVLAHSQGTIIVANVLRAISDAVRVVAAEISGQDASGLQTSIARAAHGTITRSAAASLEDLDRRVLGLLAKLEIYTFANCADRMTYLYSVAERDGRVDLPHLEHFGNQFDVVARLGVLSPMRSRRCGTIAIEGPVFEKRGYLGWGHLLNEHYLFGIDDFLRAPRRTTPDPYLPAADCGESAPRLYKYFGGKTPPPYVESRGT